jgi:DAK2 domain fusion protein YloV
MVQAGLGWLKHHQAAINALNVYPIPDGDTGTNMLLTMQSACEEILDTNEPRIGPVVRQAAHGALMGARGNSGVILSQIWRGLARSIDDKDTCGALDLAAALREAATTAYKGVVKPVEGTILTVIRAVADESTHAARGGADLESVLERAVLSAHEAVSLTPTLLDVLREAGVVDAGGQGLFVILEGMLRQVRGQPVADDTALVEAVDLVASAVEPAEEGYGYDTQFLILGDNLNVDDIRQRIAEMGECPLVVGDPGTIKVHVHVQDPGVPISYGASLGSLRDVVVEDMQAQYRDFILSREASVKEQAADSGDIGVVAVVQGDGLARVFSSLGTAAIVPGGQTMNPSTKDLLEAIERVSSRDVIVLPNNTNVILAAEQAAKLSSKRVAVVPTKFVPQGIAALLSVNYQAGFDENVQEMLAALDDVETGEVTTATRSVTVDGVTVRNGDLIGLHDGALVVSDSTPERVVQALVEQMDAADREVITLFFGMDVEEEAAANLGELLRLAWPEREVEVISGEQPHYHYIVSVE